YRSTVTSPGDNRYTRYSRRGEPADGIWLGAVTGKGVTPERVRPKPGSTCHSTPPASTLRLQCSASIETTPPLGSTKPSTWSRAGAGGGGLMTGTVTVMGRSPAPRMVTVASWRPAGARGQSTLTARRVSVVTVPAAGAMRSQAALVSVEKVAGARARLR